MSKLGFRSYQLLLLAVLAAGSLPAAYPQKNQKEAAFNSFGPLNKVSGHLLNARTDLAQGRNMAAVLAENDALKARGDQLEVEIRLKELSPDILDSIVAAGVEVTSSHEKYAVVHGYITADRLDELAGIPQVSVVHPPYGATRNNVGSVSNQADASIRADSARTTYGVDGTGITVGVLSDSFHDTIGGTATGASCGTAAGCTCTLTGSSPQTSGDLPSSVTVLDNGPGGGSDEGAGMAELIADLVPGADLMFRTAFRSEADFGAGITELKDCGADVIVDDIIYFAEPMFQDGFVGQAAQDAVDSGVPYFSSAGNHSTFGVADDYSDVSATDDTTFPPTGEDFTVFTGGNEYAAITLPAGCSVRLVLQWNEPFSGSLGTGATTDLDLYMCTSESAAACSAVSASAQGNCAGGASGDPLELGLFTNTTGASATFYMAVDHYCGAGGADTSADVIAFRVATFESCGSTVAYESGIFDKPQIYGHAAAEGVVAVAAVFYGEIDFAGAIDPPSGQIDVESFSALGGDIPFYFAGDGTPLAGAPMTRFKPEIAAPDGTNTTFFGSDIGFDADTDPNFFGTSAAAPHAAAVAALMLDSSGPLTPAGVTQVLSASAVDIESAGVDTLSGYGLVDAKDAVQTVTDSTTGCISTLDLSAQTISGTQYFRACDEITAGTAFGVSASGGLRLEVGSSGKITLMPGFSVTTGGTFAAETGAF